jgi:FixJ family two-component response regulator
MAQPMDFIPELEMLRRRRRAGLQPVAAGDPSSADSSGTFQWSAYLIAVVDDEASVGSSLARLLRSMGFRTQVFVSGEAFLASEAALMCQCALLDIHMPRMTGFDVLAQWQAKGLDGRIVTMSACGAPENASRALSLGAVAHLRKPIDAAVLLEAVESAVQRH